MTENKSGRLDADELADEVGATRSGLGDILGALMVGGDGGAGAASAGTDLGGIQGLLGGLLGGGTGTGQSGAGAGGIDLGGLLGGLLGDGTAGGASGLVEETGLSPSIVQAALPLLFGALMKGGASRSAGISEPATDDMAALLIQAQQTGVPDYETVRSSATAVQLAKGANIDLPAAIEALQMLLAALTGNAAKAKPKPKPASSNKPKPKPKPQSSTAKPKPQAATSAKPKPSASGSAKPKPKPKPKPAAKPTGSTKPKNTGKQQTGNKRSTGGG